MALKVAQSDWNFRCSIGHRFYFVVYSNNVSIVRRFRECKWLPVTLGSPSVSMKQLKLKAMFALRFMCKHIIDNMCYISQGIGVSRISDSKSDLQGHSRSLVGYWCNLIGHIRFPISLPLYMSLILDRFRDYLKIYFQKLIEVTWSRPRPFRVVCYPQLYLPWTTYLPVLKSLSPSLWKETEHIENGMVWG